MQDRFGRSMLVLVAILLAALLVQPYAGRWFYPAATPRAVEPRGDLSDLEKSTIQVFDRVSPSVVQIVARAASDEFASPEEGGGGAQSGTGFVWDDAGHVVTNDHVVQGTSQVAVRFASGQVVRAEVVGLAPNYDLAVLRISGPRQLPAPISVGASADLKVGQTCFAIGNPFGLDQSLTVGVISALKRRLPTSGGREIANVVQTDAAINPGNSGGPLLDSAGRLIGVNSAIISPSGTSAGIGFAIPVDTVNRVVPELIRNGRVPTPGIGIMAASEAVATRIGVQGIIVVRTVPGSPAERAGLRGVDLNNSRLGDVIVAANERPVHRLSDLTEELEKVGVGKSVRLTILRNGQKTMIEAPIADVGPRS